MRDQFPARYARTRRFTLGRPRSITVAPDGSRVLFVRSAGGQDPVGDLWRIDLPGGAEHRVVDARQLLGDGDEELTPEERARRERAREAAGGVVGYATDEAVRVATFTLGGRLYLVDVVAGDVEPLDVGGGVFDPRLSPDGRHVAFVRGGGLHVRTADGELRVLADEPADAVTWGQAEFVAAEEMERGRGFWWSPDSTAVLAARVDVAPVALWHIADPSAPDTEPSRHRYPAAGTENAEVSLAVLSLDGARTDVAWDRSHHPYLAQVTWTAAGPPLALVVSRDQREAAILRVDPADGTTEVVRELTDDAWVDVVAGLPRWVPGRDGPRLLTREPVDDRNRLCLDGEPATPAELEVRDVVDADADEIWFTASAGDPTEVHVHRLTLADGRITAVTTQTGVHGATRAGQLAVLVSATLFYDGVSTSVVLRDQPVTTIASVAERPDAPPDVELLELGPRRLRAALLRPREDPGGPLPVLLDPYGGPHVQRVLQARSSYLVSQWLADLGLAVLVVDGRGTPGRGPGFERAVHHDLATPVLEDQVDALHAAAEHEPRLDLARVAIRGWSFGGFLAALAVLRRPDVFRAGVAGAPVTDWSLYDTFYTERYLGTPQDQPDAYRVSSLVDGERLLIDPAPLGPGDTEPELLIVHGLADDNVVAAHALRLSHALLAAGRRHRFLPLSGVTHMTPQEVVAENLLRLEAGFLREVLELPDGRG